MLRSVFVVLATIAMASPGLAQGITLVQRETRGTQATSRTVQMDRTHVKADVSSGSNQSAFVYDGDAQVLRIINIGRKTYSELTREQAAQIGQQLTSAMAAMQAQLANLPPAQRAMAERMMGGRGGAAAAAAPIEYRRGAADRVGQWACTKYDGYSGAEKVVEICATDPSALGLVAADFEVLKQLAGFMKEIVPDAAAQVTFNGNETSDGFAGVPIRMSAVRQGRVESTMELTEIKREALPASTFDVPAGFRREQFPAGR